MFCAHIDPVTFKEQSVKEHLKNVSEMARQFGDKVSLGNTAGLAGILHDMGKETKKFNNYIHYSSKNPNDKSLKGTITHSTAGAKFIYENFYASKDIFQKLTAQIISLAICSHHGGLMDCLNLHGEALYTDRMTSNEEILSYKEALTNYQNDCFNFEKINQMFDEATIEMRNCYRNIEMICKNSEFEDKVEFKKFAVGLVQKYIFSCIVDADRYDTYNFVAGLKFLPKMDKISLWDELLKEIETALEKYPKISNIDLLRSNISTQCGEAGLKKPGIYKLSVPTGGGKTLSSLRYALQHAKEFKKDRIFYIIPFTTIIDQTAKEFKAIFRRDDIILEHHSNLVVDNNQEEYKLLTERWDSPIVITTMVQFLDTLFSGGTQNVRRLHNFANAIFIFDEIQAIPIKCVNMFNSAINFLVEICHATVVVCTATQPCLETTQMPLKLSKESNIIDNNKIDLSGFKRVNLVDKRIVSGYGDEDIRDMVIDIMENVKSILVIVNTKNTAKAIFNELKLANKVLRKEKQYSLFHLSTNMCPTHRMKILQAIKEKLGHNRVVCISTQLIEAGVNISFGCVIRDLAGLDSIAQAAGRCNRHGENKTGNVYIVNIKNENISKLVDIKKGQECTLRVLNEFQEMPELFENDLLSEKAMKRYYKYYFHNRENDMYYNLPKPNNDCTLYQLLASNSGAVQAFKSRTGKNTDLILEQSFKIAGDNFRVIDQNTTGVIVPYGEEGKALIANINGKCNIVELKKYLKKAQQFSVNLYETERKYIEGRQGIVELNNGGVLALIEGFYSEEIGVTVQGEPMNFLNS